MHNPTRRSSLNKNLTLTTASEYRGMRVNQSRGPLIVEYLDRLSETIQRALEDHPRLLAIRFDLRFPHKENPCLAGQENAILQRFFESMREKIKHDRQRARAENPYAHDSTLRYAWAREQDSSRSPHYHCLLLLNRDAYYVLGDIRSSLENLANRIAAAWASALRMSWAESHALVHFSERGVYRIQRGDEAGLAALFYRVSYFTKEATKSYGNWVHAFGCSRRH